MSIFDEIKRKAQEYAEHAHAKISRLDKQLAEIEKQKAKIDAEREKARGSLKRAANFPVKHGADYLCLYCWVDDDVTSTLRPVPSTDRHDIFRCNICQAESTF
jgi:seryl-tRNA synthetase